MENAANKKNQVTPTAYQILVCVPSMALNLRGEVLLPGIRCQRLAKGQGRCREAGSARPDLRDPICATRSEQSSTQNRGTTNSNPI